jgi:predicted aspartyl protease
MMQGFVNQSCEAIIRVAVGSAHAPKQMVDALIDTGFTGFLSLPQSTIMALGLPWHFRDVGTLGDGSEAIFDMYRTHLRSLSGSRKIDKLSLIEARRGWAWAIQVM